MFEKVENKKISQLIIDQIQEMIFNGTLKTGDQLPSERELALMLNVGRPALREAIKALEVLGFVECKQGLGNYITNNIENSFFKPLSLSFKLSNGNVEEILELRSIIESHTVMEACKIITNVELKNLYDIHKKIIEVKSAEEKAYYNREFHLEIAKISQNKLIVNLLESIHYLLDLFIDKSAKSFYYSDNNVDEMYYQHLGIIQSIESKDSVRAQENLNVHLSKVNMVLLKKTV